MKKIVPLLFLLFCGSVAMGQMALLGQSASFKEAAKGRAKLLLLSNGNTLLCHNIDGDIKLRLYGLDYKLKLDKEFDIYDMGTKYIEFLNGFELDSNVIIFLRGYKKRAPTLIRIIISGRSGEVIAKEIVHKLPRNSFRHIGVGKPAYNFYVRKDPYSENYAIAIINYKSTELSNFIEIRHYNSKSVEIGKAFMSKPIDEIESLGFKDMIVLEDQEVHALIYVNSKNASGKKSELLLASLKGDSVSYKEMPIESKNGDTKVIGKYNKALDRMMFLSVVEMTKKEMKASGAEILGGSDYYKFQLLFVKPKTKEVEMQKELSLKLLDNKVREIYGKDVSFHGMPQNLFIHDDGGFTIALEKGKQLTKNRINSRSRSVVSYSMYYYIGDMGFLSFDNKREQVASNLIPRNQLIGVTFGNKFRVYPFYHYDYSNSLFPLVQGFQYRPFTFLNTKEKKYVLFNETQYNISSHEDGKIKLVRSVAGCDAYSFKLDKLRVLPNCDMFFDKPKENEHSVALFSVSDYSNQHNVYVTLKLYKEGREKKMRVVWLQPD